MYKTRAAIHSLVLQMMISMLLLGMAWDVQSWWLGLFSGIFLGPVITGSCKLIKERLTLKKAVA